LTHYSSANQLLRPGEVGLVIFTEGRDFTVNADGSGSTGDWAVDPLRRVDWIFIYYRRDPADASHNELFMARSGDLEGPRPPVAPGGRERYLINLRDIKFVGQTTVNWHKFASAGALPIRYIPTD
jgi:hypothetical protein